MMATVLLIFHFILSVVVGTETTLSLFDGGIINYQNITPFCRLGEFCADQNTTTNKRFHVGCECDEECGFYGDCCRDSPFFRPSDDSVIQFSCVAPAGFKRALRMVGSCPPEASAFERDLCTAPGDTNPLLGSIPISVNTTDYGTITYRNVYCAQCNNLNQTVTNYQLWNIRALCNYTDVISSVGSEVTLRWDNDVKKWVDFIGKKRVECDPVVGSPPDLETRVCSGKRVIDSCPVEWADSMVARLCKSYNAEIRAGEEPVRSSNLTIYKNKYCFKCNGGNPKDVLCEYNLTKGYVARRPVARKGIVRKPGFQSIIIIMNTTRNHCKYGEVYDPFLQICTTLLPPRKIRNAHPLLVPSNHTEKEINVSRIDHCHRYVIKEAVYELSPDNMTLTVLKYERNFTREHFRLTGDGQVEICLEDVPTRLLDSFTYFISLITMFGLIVSIFFLLVHLGAVALVAELRNLSGISLASLCLALLAAYVSFIAGGFLTQDPEEWCFYVAVLTFYFFMSAFFWMMVLAFDVARVLKESVRFFRSVNGLQWKRFWSYTVIAWGAPLLLTGGTVYVELAPQGTVDDRLRPQFGLQHCWFASPISLLVFFAIPLTIIMVVNMGFFVFAAVVTSKTSVAAGHRKNCRLYVKLTIMLGLTWIVGLLASVFDSYVLWVVFAVFNTLQGFFIFVMFTLTPRVLSGLSRALPCFKLLNRNGNKEGNNGTGSKETSFSSSKITFREENGTYNTVHGDALTNV